MATTKSKPLYDKLKFLNYRFFYSIESKKYNNVILTHTYTHTYKYTGFRINILL